MTQILSKRQVILIHAQLVKRTGGTDGVRDENLLDSALQAPFQGFDDIEFFPTIQEKAARLGHGLIMNHRYGKSTQIYPPRFERFPSQFTEVGFTWALPLKPEPSPPRAVTA